MISEFLHKEITATDEDITVSRVRDSTGFASIKIQVGSVSIIFKNEMPDNSIAKCSSQELVIQICGNDYEQKAFKLAKLIDEIASNPCILPGEWKV